MASSLTIDVVENDVQFTLVELSRACRAREEEIRVWVVEGVLTPVGVSPEERLSAPPEQWRFAGPALRRARLALTLTRELEINAPGVAFALDLMDRIDALEASLRRSGAG